MDTVAASHLQEDQRAEDGHSPAHALGEVSLGPEVDGGQREGRPDQSAPHPVAVLHQPDELEVRHADLLVLTVNGGAGDVRRAAAILVGSEDQTSLDACAAYCKSR